MKKFPTYKLLRLTVAFAVLTGYTAVLCGAAAGWAWLAKLQFAPALLRCFAGAGAGALTVVAVHLLLTLAAGRWYCGLFCPMGIFIDLLDLVPLPWKRAEKRDLFWSRLAVLVAVFTLAAAGMNYGFMLLDPYSNYGQIVHFLETASFSAGALIIFILIAGLSLWKRRIFCTALCPVGTMLGIAARFSRWHLELGEKCVKCGKCEKICPAGCIDVPAGKVDNSRCIRCLACLDQCPVKTVKFTFVRKKTAVVTDESRRDFIRRGGVAIGSAAAGTVLLKLGMDKLAPALPFSQIAPPGGGSVKRLEKRCTACQICVQNCPQGIILPAYGGDGAVSLNLKKACCLWDCNMCSQSCPTGALKELDLAEKQRTQIALAKVDDKCVGCRKCTVECPAGAISIKEGMAVIAEDCCIGCGKCTFVCPVKALSITPVAEQRLLPERTVKKGKNRSAGADKKAVINLAKCISCGCCAANCPVKAIELDDTGTPKPIDPAKCIGCAKCVSECPVKAISMQIS